MHIWNELRFLGIQAARSDEQDRNASDRNEGRAMVDFGSQARERTRKRNSQSITGVQTENAREECAACGGRQEAEEENGQDDDETEQSTAQKENAREMSNACSVKATSECEQNRPRNARGAAGRPIVYVEVPTLRARKAKERGREMVRRVVERRGKKMSRQERLNEQVQVLRKELDELKTIVRRAKQD